MSIAGRVALGLRRRRLDVTHTNLPSPNHIHEYLTGEAVFGIRRCNGRSLWNQNVELSKYLCNGIQRIRYARTGAFKTLRTHYRYEEHQTHRLCRAHIPKSQYELYRTPFFLFDNPICVSLAATRKMPGRRPVTKPRHV